MNRRVLIVVPHRVRDLEGHALLAFHLETTHGYEAALCGPDELADRMLEYAPDALVLDDLGWAGRAELVRLAKRLHMRVAVVPIAGLWESKEEELRAAGQATGVARLIDVYLSWGHGIRRSLITSGLMSEEQVHTVGCTRFDLYSEPYRRLMPSRPAFLRRLGIERDNAPLVLWSTNTPQFARGIEHEVRSKVDFGRIPEDEARTELDEEMVQFREHSRMVVELAWRHPEWDFVIKVHPLEPVDAYRALAQGVPNLKVAFDAPIREFLFHCDVLLQRGCTTAAEAWILDKPVLELAIGDYRRHWAPPGYAAGNHVVTSVNEADEAITAYLHGAPIDDAQRRARATIASEFYFRADGRASERCAEHLARLLSPPAHTDADQAKIRAAVSAERSRGGAPRPSALLKRLLRIDRGQSLRFWRGWLGGRNQRPSFVRADRDIAPAMVEQLYGSFKTVRGGAS